MGTKICARCKVEFPKTTEYFFIKRCKQQNKNGVAEYISFRHVCKKCHGRLRTERHRIKRCEELGCTLENYQEEYRKEVAYKKLKYKELADIAPRKRVSIIKKMNNGYEFTTFEKYKDDVRQVYLDLAYKRRKYDYGTKDKLTTQQMQAKYLEVLQDSRLALIMGHKVNEIPKEMLEVKRNIILLKRLAGLTRTNKH